MGVATGLGVGVQVGGNVKSVGVRDGTEIVGGVVGYGKGLMDEYGSMNKTRTKTTTTMVATINTMDKKSKKENFTTASIVKFVCKSSVQLYFQHAIIQKAGETHEQE